ncbi:class I SAM-dependent methyltransferase [Mycobacterium talmoniae]|uniref:S-adenosyl-L-methionine-dependent methyltransferase n=1 Tax=Mycobacterium talmoniae TaxID=1858794 RepID=A0A1S1NLP9_9MYCO|nr:MULTISPECIES: class I SAM-dependent methyltransferase [Mycobacterium]OHV04860.1 SAM-dependent methyltransferase [Mycobacterium talmoniae]PQM44931.1 Putative S-adenosyl-L-methionine-dependent methyltransferase [Mycobacterium talmoniae]TDH57288.1 SAM-dependent methyltransferase [Mycobacterium eburneum]
MARTDGDTWDLASSVGATATAVAAQRAVASSQPRPLIDDPFAEPLVTAVGVEFFTKFARGELAGTGEDPTLDLVRLSENLAVRTKYFDDFFADATDAGIRQVVILASGLDARAYRLAWPAGTTVFEVDQPAVIEFKTRTLANLGAHPTAERRPVAIDLRDDWPSALQTHGFDPSRPTAWLTEGLLGYLPPDAQDRLLDNITRLSAPGSRLGTESVANLTEADRVRIQQRSQQTAELWRAWGYDGADMDMTELLYFGDRNDTADYLNRRGWRTVAASNAELFGRYGLTPFGDDEMPFTDASYVTAALD